MAEVFARHPMKKVGRKPSVHKLMWWDSFFGKMNVWEGTKLWYNYVLERYVEGPDGRKYPLDMVHLDDGDGNVVTADSATAEQIEEYGVQVMSAYRMRAEPETVHPTVKDTVADKQAVRDAVERHSGGGTSAEISYETGDGAVISVGDGDLSDLVYDIERENIDCTILR